MLEQKGKFELMDNVKSPKLMENSKESTLEKRELEHKKRLGDN